MLGRMKRIAWVAVVPLLLATAACGKDATKAAEPDAASTSSSTPSASSPSASSPSASSPATAEVSPLLDFTATTVDGASFDGTTLAGRPTVLWFWAPWCPTCRGQIPEVQALAGKHGGEVNVIGIGSLDSAEAIAGFADDVPGVTHIEDEDGELWSRFEVTEQSSFVVLDADGTVAFEAGYGGSDDLGGRVENLLG